MSRRSIVFPIAASLLAGVVPVDANTARPELPRANCPRRLVDPADDAKINPNLPSTDGGDITGVLLRVTPDELQVFLSIKDLKDPASMPMTDGKYRFDFTGKVLSKKVYFSVFEVNSQQPYATLQGKDVGWPKGNTAGGPTGTPADELPGFTANYYPDVNYVIFTAPRARLEQNLGAPLVDGTEFTEITAVTQHYIERTVRDLDTLNVPAAQAKWAAGDDYCFGAAPGTISDLTTPNVEFSDAVTLSAKLVNEAGAAVAGKQVEFRVAGEATPVSGTTDANGVATATYSPTVAAGTHAVTAFFAGDTEVGKTRLDGGTITVAAEGVSFKPLAVTKPTTTTRTVTATLLDNDGKTLANQKVDWYVNGKKIATVVTDRTGRSVFKTAKPTQTVQAKFTGVTGKYKSAASNSAKV